MAKIAPRQVLLLYIATIDCLIYGTARTIPKLDKNYFLYIILVVMNLEIRPAL